MKTLSTQEVRESLHVTIDYIMDGVESGRFKDFKIQCVPIWESILTGDKTIILGTINLDDPDLKTILPQIKGTRLLLEVYYAEPKI